MKQLKAMYKITEREVQIVQHLCEGHTNKDTADILEITENTLKTHITNIYNKLNVNNKVELMNLLKDFHLIPEKTADRIVLLKYGA